MLSSIIGRTSTNINIDTFNHPILTDDEQLFGCRLGFDTWADTSCSGKHAFVESFVEGRTVNATGFTSSLGTMKDLPIANVLYAYDTNDGNTIILENHNTIYLGENMDDSLLNPIQSEENDVRIDLRPKRFYPHDTNDCQSILFPDGTKIPLEFDGVLPFIPVRRPSPTEIDTCRRLSLTSEDDWDPTSYGGFVSSITNKKHENILPTNTNSSINFISSLLFYHNDEYISINAIKSNKQNTLTPERLSQMWNIGLHTAARTLQASTHKCIRTTGMLSRRYKTDKSQLRYKQLSKQFGTFYVDYLKIGCKSLRGFIGGTVYTNKLGFKMFFPCADEQGTTTAATMRTFIEIVGLPPSLHSDGHNNFSEGAFKKLLRRFGIPQTFTEPHSPWQNRAESAIGEIKKHSRRLMQRTNTPIRLWCFCYEYSATILSLCATGRYDLKGRSSYEAVMNYTPDISEYVSFEWFQWCFHFDETTKAKRLCRWLGPAHNIGQSFCSYILLDNAQFITRSSVLALTADELKDDTILRNREKFMQSVTAKIGNHREPLFHELEPGRIYYDAFNEEINDDMIDLPYGDEYKDIIPDEIDEPYLEQLDQYIGASVVIPGTTNGVEPVLALIKGRKRDHLGNPIGLPNDNPILDTRIYQLEFPDGRVEEYGMNIIAENLISHTDENGWDTGIFEEIISARTDPNVAIPQGEHATTNINGRDKPIITTKGWEILIRWKDQSTSWLPLSVVKESYPVQLSEYAIANQIHNEPAFKWWTHHTLKKRDRIINKINTARPHRKGKLKYGILIPATVEEALRLDKKNNNTLWADAMEKEMKNSRIAFELLSRDSKPPPGYKKITCHMNFEIKMDLRRKARYVAGGQFYRSAIFNDILYSSQLGERVYCFSCCRFKRP